MRPLRTMVLTLLFASLVASPALARVAVIETMAPLQDHTEQIIKLALKDAIQSAVKGAVAMGLPWIKVGEAHVLEDMVTVQILATDTAPEETQISSPGGQPDHSPAPIGVQDF